MPATLAPISPGEPSPPLWEVGWARQVTREALRAHLGEPFYVESDSHCTFGGEEDWWAYRSATGEVVAVCLRVPYGDAVLCLSRPSEAALSEACALLEPWPIEVFGEPRLR